MRPASSLKPNDLAVLIVGDPGSRKTTMALQFPKPYVFDADHNMAAPMAFLESKYPGMVQGVNYDLANVDENGKEIPPPARYARMITCMNIAATSPDVETIIGDSFTAITDILVSECKRLGGIPENSPMRIQDWGTFGNMLKKLVMTLRGTGKIVVFTAHNRIELDEADKRFKSFLNLPGQAASYLSGLFTDVLNPYCAMQGMGPTMKHVWMVRALPESETDHRGIKSSMGLPYSSPYDTVIDKIKTYTKPKV